MADTAVTAIVLVAATVFGPGVYVGILILWLIDRIDHIVNPWTRARVRAHNEILASHRREAAAKMSRE